MTLEVAAKELEMSRFALARLESGTNKVDVHLARSMMDLYDVYDSGLLEEVRKAAPRGWWTKYGIDDRGYIGMETEASRLCEFSVTTVPGLLQTKDYMTALMRAGRMDWTAAQLANHVAARLVRQARLTDDEFPLHFTAIVDEAALQRQVGGREVMHAQLMHLLACADYATLDLHVLPNSAGAHASMDGAFTIVTFPEVGDPDIMYVEYPTGTAHIEGKREVAQARLLFDGLLSMALCPSESAGFIGRKARDYRPD
jgi:hypothetical protein